MIKQFDQFAIGDRIIVHEHGESEVIELEKDLNNNNISAILLSSNNVWITMRNQIH